MQAAATCSCLRKIGLYHSCRVIQSTLCSVLDRLVLRTLEPQTNTLTTRLQTWIDLSENLQSLYNDEEKLYILMRRVILVQERSILTLSELITSRLICACLQLLSEHRLVMSKTRPVALEHHTHTQRETHSSGTSIQSLMTTFVTFRLHLSLCFFFLSFRNTHTLVSQQRDVRMFISRRCLCTQDRYPAV